MVIMEADFFDNYLSPYIIDGEIDVAKVLEYMPLFINIKALKNTGELSKRCSETKNAIHIIKNGVGELAELFADRSLATPHHPDEDNGAPMRVYGLAICHINCLLAIRSAHWGAQSDRRTPWAL